MGAFRYMFNDFRHDPRLNGRGVPRVMGGDGKLTPLDGKSEFDVAVERLKVEKYWIHGLKNVRSFSVYATYGSAAAGQLEGVVFFTVSRLGSDYLITTLEGQDNMAIYRHSFIDVVTSVFPNPVIAPVALGLRIYIKGEGDKNAN